MRISKVLINKAAAIALSLGVFTVASALIFSAFADLPGYSLFTTPNALKWFLFSALAFLVGILLPTRNDFGTMVLWVVYYMHIFPWIVLGAYYLGLGSDNVTAVNIMYNIIISTIYIVITYIVFKFAMHTCLYKVSTKQLLYLYWLLITIFIIILLIKMGPAIELPSYKEIYQQRSLFKENIGNMPGGKTLSRFLLIITYTIIPFSLATSSYLIQIKKYKRTAIIITLLSFSASFLVFSLAAFKSTVALALLSFFAPVLVYRLRRIAAEQATKLFWLLAFAGIVSLATYLVNADSRLLLHYFRRTFIVPGMQVWFYIDIFPLYPPQLIRDAPLIVSQTVYGTTGSANSGLIGSGLALGGAIGVLFNILIFSIWLVVSKSYARKVPIPILVPLAVIYGYLFANSATTTVLFSYGAVLAPFMFALVSSSLKRIGL